MTSPLKQINQWWQEAKINSPLKQKNAICLSTINDEGFPSGRFVDLKEVNEHGLIFCTSFDSNKGIEISKNSKTAITIWWDHVGYQIRIVGFASKISDATADKFWTTRSHDAQIATLSLKQSQPIESLSKVKEEFSSFNSNSKNNHFARPQNWGGYIVTPYSIELLSFKESRLHIRELHTKSEDDWQKAYLQP